MGQESEALPRPLLTVDYHWSGAGGTFEWDAGTRVAVRRPHERPEDWVQVSGPDDALSWYPESLIKSGDGLSGQIETAYADRVLSVHRGERLQQWFRSPPWILVENGRGETGWVPEEIVHELKPVPLERAGLIGNVLLALLVSVFTGLVLMIGLGLIYMGLTLPDAPDMPALGVGGFSVAVCAYLLARLFARFFGRHKTTPPTILMIGGAFALVFLGLPHLYILLTEGKLLSLAGFLVYGGAGLWAFKLAYTRKHFGNGLLAIPPMAIEAQLREWVTETRDDRR